MNVSDQLVTLFIDMTHLASNIHVDRVFNRIIEVNES